MTDAWHLTFVSKPPRQFYFSAPNIYLVGWMELLTNLFIKSVLIDNRECSFSSVLHIIQIVQDCSVPVVKSDWSGWMKPFRSV